MPRPNIENETIIIYNEVEEEARCWTCSPATLKKWKALKMPLTPKGPGQEMLVPKTWVIIKKPGRWD
jgi:hypothetical protein